MKEIIMGYVNLILAVLNLLAAQINGYWAGVAYKKDQPYGIHLVMVFFNTLVFILCGATAIHIFFGR